MPPPERRTKPELGSCIEVRPGVWRLRVYAGRGRYATETVGGTQGHAWWRLDQLIEATHQNKAAPGTLGDLLERWLAMKAHDLSPTTIHGYRRNVANYVTPHLGSIQLADLRGRDLDDLYQRMLAGEVSVHGGPLNPATIGQVHAVIRGALGQAVRWEMVPSNVALAASPPKLRRYELDPPTTDHIAAALTALWSNPYLWMFMRLAAVTGARRGEVCALRWSDFDLESNVVTIAHGIVDVPGARRHMKATKTGKAKRLALDERTVGALWWYREVQRERARRNGAKLVADPFLFSAELDGSRPWAPAAVSRAWGRVRRKAELPSTVRLHDLRHALATRMLAAGDDIRTVAGRLGHGDPSTTLRVYAHWVPEKDRDAADRIGEEF